MFEILLDRFLVEDGNSSWFKNKHFLFIFLLYVMSYLKFRTSKAVLCLHYTMWTVLSRIFVNWLIEYKQCDQTREEHVSRSAEEKLLSDLERPNWLVMNVGDSIRKVVLSFPL